MKYEKLKALIEKQHIRDDEDITFWLSIPRDQEATSIELLDVSREGASNSVVFNFED
jgi:hypothetical protein